MRAPSGSPERERGNETAPTWLRPPGQPGLRSDAEQRFEPTRLDRPVLPTRRLHSCFTHPRNLSATVPTPGTPDGSVLARLPTDGSPGVSLSPINRVPWREATAMRRTGQAAFRESVRRHPLRGPPAWAIFGVVVVCLVVSWPFGVLSGESRSGASLPNLGLGHLLTGEPVGVQGGQGRTVGPASTSSGSRVSSSPAAAPPPPDQVVASLNLLTNQLSAAQVSTPGCVLPVAIAFDPANLDMYLSCGASSVVMPINGTGQPLPAVDASGHGGAHAVVVPVEGSPSAIAYDPALGWLYVLVHPGHGAALGFTGVVAIDGQTNRVVGEVALPGANSLTVDGSNSRLYVAGAFGTIYEVAGTTLLASSPLLAAAGNPQIVWDSSNGRIYVAGSSTVWALTPELYPGDWTAKSYATAVSSPTGIAYDDGNDLVYIVGDGGASIVGASSAPWVTNVSVGELRSAVAYASGDGNLYVTLPSQDQVAVFDPANDTVLGQVTIGSDATAIAYDSSNEHLFVPLGKDRVDILPLGTEGVVTSGAVNAVPGGVAYDGATGAVFVSLREETVVDFLEGDPDRPLIVGGSIDLAPAISATVGGAMLTGTLSGGSGGITTTENGMLIMGVTTPGGSTGVVVLPGNDSDDTFVNNGNLVLTGGTGSASIAADPSTGGIVVANLGSGTLSVLNPNGSSFILGGTLTLGSDPDAVAVGNGSYLYVANGGSDNVSVVQASPSAGTRVVGSLTVGGLPDALAFDSANGYLYVANQLSDSVSVIDTTTNTVVGSLAVGLGPSSIVYDSANQRLYVANAGSNNISVIDGSRSGGLTVLGSIAVGTDPTSIALDTATGELLVADGASGAITILPTAPLYSLTFTESGLPVGASWAGSIDSVQGLTDGGAIAFNVTNGTFVGQDFYAVGLATYRSMLTSADATAVVAGSPGSIIVPFQHIATGPVSFSESGLPGGHVWSMTVDGDTQANTTLFPPAKAPNSPLCPFTLLVEVDCGLLEFQVPVGTVTFTVHAPPAYGVALIKGDNVLSSSSVYFNSTAGGHWLLEFGILRSITFVESALARSGLYPGANWSVTLLPAVQRDGPAAEVNGSDPTAVEFMGPVGAAYRFAIAPPGPEYRVSPSSGILRVPSLQAVPGAFTKPVQFVLLTSNVVFRETGSPGRSVWSVAITDGTSPAVHYPFSEKAPGPIGIPFRLPAGTYFWAASVPGSALPAVTGSVQVSYPSAPTTVPVAFGTSASAAGCFAFTSNGLLLGAPVCNAKANDILVNFTQVPGAVCANQFTLGGASVGAPIPCPVGSTGAANQLEVAWSGSTSGLVVTSCSWAVSGTVVGTCPVPAPPQPTGFVLFLAEITSVSWTVNGAVVGSAIPAPANANGVVFFL
jgi:YVTN family beta-propeller protein